MLGLGALGPDVYKKNRAWARQTLGLSYEEFESLTFAEFQIEYIVHAGDKPRKFTPEELSTMQGRRARVIERLKKEGKL